MTPLWLLLTLGLTMPAEDVPCQSLFDGRSTAGWRVN